MLRFFRDHWAIFLLSLFHFLFFFGLTYLRWAAHSPSLDYHAYLQMFWNTVEGGGALTYNRLSEGQYSLFHAHFAAALLGLVPFYHLLRHPLTLYFLFNLIISTTFIPIYLFAQRVLRSKLAAVLVVLILAIYPPFVWSHRAGFAEEALAAPLLAWSFYFLSAGRPGLYFLTSFLSLTLRVNMSLPVFMLGLYALFSRRARGHGILLIGLSLFWIYFVFEVIYPRFNWGNPDFYVYGFFRQYGSSVQEIAKNILLNPAQTWPVITSPAKLSYFFDLFWPLFFLPLLAPSVLILGLPILLLNTLSGYPRMSSLWTYYHASSLPFLFFAAILGLNRLNLLWAKTRLALPFWPRRELLIKFLLVLILTRLIVYNRFSPSGFHLPFSQEFNPRIYEVGARDRVADVFIKNIPPEYSLGTGFGFLEHLAERRWLFGLNAFDGYLPDLVFFDAWANPEVLEKINQSPAYHSVGSDSFFYLFARAELVQTMTASQFIESFSAGLDPNRGYLAFLKAKENQQTFPTANLGTAVDIYGDFYLAQKITGEGQPLQRVSFPIEKSHRPNAPRPLLPFRPGQLQLRLVDDVGDQPDLRQVIFEKTQTLSAFSAKTDLATVELDGAKLQPGRTYWLVFSHAPDSFDQEDNHAYRLYLAKREKPTALTNLRNSSDGALNWSDRGFNESDVVYHLERGSPPPRELKLNLGSAEILSGQPLDLKNRLSELASALPLGSGSLIVLSLKQKP